MKRWLNDLDLILRGEATRIGALRQDRLEISVPRLLPAIVLMAMLYGVCMGFFSGFGEGGPHFMQWLAGAVKVPSVLLLTLVVTVPSLYVFNALVGSRLSLLALIQLVVASLAVSVAVLASLGPIVAFFSVSTTSYPFLLLLNVLVSVVAGLFGFWFMLQTLYRWTAARYTSLPPSPQPDTPQDSHLSETGEPQTESESPATPITPQVVEETGSLCGVQGYVLDRRVRTVFRCWIMVFGLVVAQMSWVLRPLLGNPTEPFQWLCKRESNFFQAIFDAFRALLS